ncbi:MAG: amino acid permease [Bacillota bacterium]
MAPEILAAGVDSLASPGHGRLQRGLASRHLSMISIGGVIGVGMFLGSAATVKLAGPAVVISFALGGVIMMMVMLALAEMSVARPVEGSFRTYAAEALHPYAGYVVGWTYWISWVVIMAAEIVAASTYMRLWVSPELSLAFGLVFAVGMTLVNLASVRSFGEFEFWFAMIKVAAIIAFILIGAAAILGIGPFTPIGLTNYVAHGGFAPKGITGVLLAMVMVMVAYGGTEVIGVAAAETLDPARSVPRAVNGVAVRTIILYIGSMIVLVGTIPWFAVGLGASPFVRVYQLLKIPAAADIMNFVVITAALSSMNSGLYTSSRMLYSLAESGAAPKFFTRLGKRSRVPYLAVVGSTFFLYIGVILYYVVPKNAFLYITGIGGFGFLFSWLIISLSQICMRRRILKKDPPALKFKMPGFPYTSWITVALVAGVIITLPFVPGQRIGFISGLVWLGAVSIYWVVSCQRRFSPRLITSKGLAGLEFASFLGPSKPNAPVGDLDRDGLGPDGG